MICQRCAKERDGIHTCTPSKLVRKLEQQRDELLEALKAAVQWASPMQEAPKEVRPDWFDQARTAIAKVKP